MERTPASLGAYFVATDAVSRSRQGVDMMLVEEMPVSANAISAIVERDQSVIVVTHPQSHPRSI